MLCVSLTGLQDAQGAGNSTSECVPKGVYRTDEHLGQ